MDQCAAIEGEGIPRVPDMNALLLDRMSVSLTEPKAIEAYKRVTQKHAVDQLSLDLKSAGVLRCRIWLV